MRGTVAVRIEGVVYLALNRSHIGRNSAKITAEL